MDRTIVHFEIPVDDPDRAVEFYRDLFGWAITKAEAASQEYWPVSTVPVDSDGRPERPGINGGLVRRNGRDEGLVNYVEVEDVAQYATDAVALGGEVVVPRTAVAGMGWFVRLKDTEGNVFGLWQTDRKAREEA